MKTAVLLKSSVIGKHVPETYRFSPYSLQRLLAKYKVVYIKPDRGRHGRGVMKAEILPGTQNTSFRLYFGKTFRAYASYDELVEAAKSVIASRAYIVQQGIQMLAYKSHPFDIRIIVQPGPRRKWESTGYLARVAGPQRIVTNFNNGGTPLELKTVLSEHMTGEEATLYISRLCLFSEKVAQHCHRSLPDLIRLGLDYAIDSEKKAWILEFNTLPQFNSFKRLQDKTMFRRISRYYRARRYYTSVNGKRKP